MVDEMFTAGGGEYELTGVKPNPRRHYSGRDIWFRTGDHIHGDDDDFLGRATSDKYLIHGRGPYEPCAEPEHLFGEIGLGVRKNNLSAIVPVFAGLRLGGVGHDHYGTAYERLVGLGLAVDGTNVFVLEGKKGGLALGAVPIGFIPLVAEKKGGLLLGPFVPAALPAAAAAGLELGIIGTAIVTDVGRTGAGLALGGEGTDVTDEVKTSIVGLDFGGKKHESAIEEFALVGLALSGDGTDVVTTEGEEKKGGLDFGSTVLFVGSEVGGKSAGIEFGGDGTGVDEDAELEAAGLELGGVVNAIESGPPTPGTDCSSAALISLATDYTYSVTSPAVQWFRFPIVSGTQYHVRLTIHSGIFAVIDIRTGTSCGSAMSQGEIFNSGDCLSFTAGATENCYINAGAGGPPLTTMNYTIHADTGPC